MIEINWNPPKRDLKIFSVLLIIFFAIVAYAVHSKWDANNVAIAIVSVAFVLGVACFFLPEVARRVYVGWMILVFPIGWVVSHVILAVIFYGVFTPVALIMRLCGYDPMKRRFEAEAQTYWIERTEQPKSEQYFRQF